MKTPTKDFLNTLAHDATDEIQRKLREKGFEFTDENDMWGKLVEAIEDTLETIYPGADYTNYN